MLWIEREVLTANMQRILGTDVAEIAPQLDLKVFQFGQEAPMQIGFVMDLGQIEKFDAVGVYEDAGSFRVTLSPLVRLLLD